MYCLANGTSYINNKSIGMIDMIRQRPCQIQSALPPLPPHQHHTPATISLSLTHKVSMLQGMRVRFHNVPVQKTSLSVEELGAYQPYTTCIHVTNPLLPAPPLPPNMSNTMITL